MNRRRPAVHFTAPHGWINDPHAIAYIDGRYHLFYQHNPQGLTWSPACHWGHATSPRLTGWTDHGDVLAPGDGDDGIWSGAIAVDDGGATLLYTSITEPDWARGRVALAHGAPDRMNWTKDPRNPVVVGPPHGLDVVAFRDPMVWRDGDRWRMIVGSGLPGVGGAALQYTATDLAAWTYYGVIATGNADPAQPAWTGKLWECPQLFELDGSWVLLVSVWDDDVLHHVAYAVGEYDGGAFNPRRWGKFSRGASLYATTTFIDAAGVRCAMSWLRERPDAELQGFAGAHSIPVQLRLDGDILRAEPHPDVLADARPVAGSSVTGGNATAIVARGGGAPWSVTVTDSDGASLIDVAAEPAGALTVRAAGNEPITTPWARHGEVHVVIDADIVEVLGAIEGIAAVRLPGAADSIRVSSIGDVVVSATSLA